MMVLMDSPYHAWHAVSVTREVALGERKRKDNPFHWYEVALNFTGDPGYQPHLPWVYKRMEEGCVSPVTYTRQINKMTGRILQDK